MNRLPKRALMVALFVAAAVCTAAPPEVPAILPNVWHARGELSWSIEDGGVWSSLGHSATVLSILPDGKPGEAKRITMTVWKVKTFDAETKAPTQTEKLVEKTIDMPGAPSAENRVVSHTLHVPGKTFRYCLMVKPKTVADEEEEASAPPRTVVQVAVIEMLQDPTIPTTSKWIEPTNGPEAGWAAGEALLAPWADGSPREGDFSLDQKGQPRFGPSRAPKPRPVEKAGPKLDTGLEGED